MIHQDILNDLQEYLDRTHPAQICSETKPPETVGEDNGEHIYISGCITMGSHRMMSIFQHQTARP